jgi:N6-L-threonylcarbamoyladenine synthase
MGNMILLALETSCDETSAAVIRDGTVLANVVSSQIKLHAEYGGVVPELATREHLRNFLPVTRGALQAAGVTATDLEAIAATQGPGLPNALLIGFQAAEAMAFALRRPFVGIHHHEAHLYSPWVSGDPPRAAFDQFEPNVSLIVSGGHTMLVHVRAELDHVVLGSTLDDAAGECFDKVAKLIGLPYPGGPEMDRLAIEGNPRAQEFPRPLLREANDDFSFAGLKTSVRYFLQKNPALLDDGKSIRDLCASVQAAIVETLVTKTLRAAKRLGVRCITASGGVTCNSALRRELAAACARNQLTLRLAERTLCTDNAAMVGILAERKLLKGVAPTALEAEIHPGWSLEAAG